MSRFAARWGIVLALVCIAASASHARAAGEAAVRVTFRAIAPIGIGHGGDVVVDLRVAGGASLADEPLELSIDGTYYRRERTDSAGSATFPLPKDLIVGEHRLTAVYPGRTNAYLTANATTTLVIDPYELTVATVPALPGMAFTLDGERFEADAEGIARLPVAKAGDHVLVALGEEYSVGGRQTTFARWSVNDEYRSEVTISIPGVGPVQAGFDVFQPASQVFVDPAGGAVEADRITSITMRSSLGQVLTYPDGSERLYKASRVVRRSSGLESVDVRYNVTDVEVDGSNVVNAGQQQFYVGSGAAWRISLLLFSARLQPKDALLGFSAGTSVEVIYPSGKSEIVEAQEDGVIFIPWLARGIYRVAVADAPGWAPAMPVALSRNQDVELRVVTYLDMGIAAAIAFGVLFGLLHRGRPHLIPNTVRAVGEGVSGMRLPMPGGQRPVLSRSEQAGAEPADSGVATPTSERKAPVKLEVAPILATIAWLTDSYALSKAPEPESRRVGSGGPVDDGLPEVAPSRVGLPSDEGPSAPQARPRKSVARAVTASAGVSRPGRSAPTPHASPPTTSRTATARARRAETPEPVSPVAADVVPKPARPKRAAKAAGAADVVPKPARSKRAAKVAPDVPSAGRAAAIRPADDVAAGKSRPRSSARPSGSAAQQVVAATAVGATTMKAKRAPRKAESDPQPRAATGAKASRATFKEPAPRPRATASTAKASTTPSPRKAPRAATAESPRTPRGRSVPRKQPVRAQAPAAPSNGAWREQIIRLGLRDPGQSYTQPAPSVASDPQQAMHLCSNCGLELRGRARFCRRCGQPIAESATADLPGPATNGRAARSTSKRRAPSDPTLAAKPPAAASPARSPRRRS